jgi:hypothetical protein
LRWVNDGFITHKHLDMHDDIMAPDYVIGLGVVMGHDEVISG